MTDETTELLIRGRCLVEPVLAAFDRAIAASPSG
jgi:hypothetical protein